MLVLKFYDIIPKQAQQQQYQQFQYFKIVLARYSDKQFKIKKAYTKLSGRWSKYNDTDREIDYVQENLDIILFEQLIGAFNGCDIHLNTPGDLYSMYYILDFFKIQELKDQIENFLISTSQHILLGYQISEKYGVEKLSIFYQQYFKQYGFLDILTKKLNFEEARKHIYRFKNKLIPTHYLYLETNLFKKLLCLHNFLAQQNNFDPSKFLDQYQIGLLISEYCLLNGQDRIKLQEIFSDAILKEKLSNEQKLSIFVEFMRNFTKNQIATFSSDDQSDDDLSDTKSEILFKDQIIYHNPVMEPIELYKGPTLNLNLLVGFKNLEFQFKTKFALFGFYLSKEIELYKQIEDEQLQLVNLMNNQTIKTSLKKNWVKFDENGLNVNNRLIIIGKKGICRYEDDVEEPIGDIRLTGCRNFLIEEVQVFNVIRRNS